RLQQARRRARWPAAHLRPAATESQRAGHARSRAGRRTRDRRSEAEGRDGRGGAQGRCERRRRGAREWRYAVNFNAADLGWIAPYLILAVTGMLLVLAEAFYKGKDRTALVGLTVAGSLAAAVASIVLYRQLGPNETHQIFSDKTGGAMLVGDHLGYVLSALF